MVNKGLGFADFVRLRTHLCTHSAISAALMGGNKQFFKGVIHKYLCLLRLYQAHSKTTLVEFLF